MKTIDQILNDRVANVEDALQVFDELSPVSLEFMIGRWKGFEIVTGHPMDGLLHPSGWYGKWFKNNEEVHPLLFFANNGKKLYSVNPKLIPLEINFPKTKILGSLMAILRPILQTKKPTARIRMITYRGKTTATMAYDNKAIFDHFVKINDNTLLGVMDLKNSPAPYIFVLERDTTQFKINF